MSNLAAYEKLDQAIDQMLASSDAGLSAVDSDIAELAQLAAELRDLPRPNFKSRLRLELEWEAAGRAVTTDAPQAKPVRPTEVLPSLFGKNWGGFPVRRSNLALSGALHAVMLLAIGAGFLAVKNMPRQADTQISRSYPLSVYVPPAGTHESGGGGSGGAAEKTPASKGAAPRSQRLPLAPPIILDTDRVPRLVVHSAVAAPPEASQLKMRAVGDPLSLLAKPANGAGVNAGFGGNRGDGVGTGEGSGRGSGIGGGCCEGIYSLGDGVTMPRAIYAPEPEFSDEARKVKHQGEVTLLAVIGADGLPKRLTVVRSLGMGLDEKALETVRTWRFEPARKNGHPVAVQMNIVVNFHLY
jgi:TonB family protein